MLIAVYSLCRDRISYTKKSFESLKRLAGAPYSHFVVDQGSTDGTPEWLRDVYQPTWLRCLPENVGIAKGANMALAAIFAAGDWDLVIKQDNDCEIISGNILSQFAEIFEDTRQYGSCYILSPAVTGIDRQPRRGRDVMLGGRRVGLTAIVGGLFHVVPAEIYRAMGQYPEDLPRGGGCDKHICTWFKRQGGEVGYVEGLRVHHMDSTGGQPAKHPEYFARKRAEWVEDDGAQKLNRS